MLKQDARTKGRIDRYPKAEPEEHAASAHNWAAGSAIEPVVPRAGFGAAEEIIILGRHQRPGSSTASS